MDGADATIPPVPDAQVTALGVDDLDDLEPLWLQLHAHHQAVAPQLAPYVDDATSWGERRAHYVDALGAGRVPARSP